MALPDLTERFHPGWPRTSLSRLPGRRMSGAAFSGRLGRRPVHPRTRAAVGRRPPSTAGAHHHRGSSPKRDDAQGAPNTSRARPSKARRSGSLRARPAASETAPRPGRDRRRAPSTRPPRPWPAVTSSAHSASPCGREVACGRSAVGEIVLVSVAHDHRLPPPMMPGVGAAVNGALLMRHSQTRGLPHGGRAGPSKGDRVMEPRCGQSRPVRAKVLSN
jgi:hypothetical protein